MNMPATNFVVDKTDGSALLFYKLIIKAIYKNPVTGNDSDIQFEVFKGIF